MAFAGGAQGVQLEQPQLLTLVFETHWFPQR